MSTETPSGPLSFIDFRLTWGVIITVVGWVGLGLIFYANTKATLAEHARQFDRVFDQFKADTAQREKVRDDVGEAIKKMADGIAQLNTQVQVANARYEAILETLKRIQIDIDRRNNRQP